MAKELFNSDFYTLPEQVQLNKEDIKKLTDSSTTQTEQLQALSTKVDTNTSNIATNTRNIATNTANIATNTSDITKIQDDIGKIDQYYLKKTDASNTYLTKTDASNTYLSKTDASNTYVTKTAIKSLEYDYFDAVLTRVGLAKIQANATIGTSITLVKDTDFTANIYNIDMEHKTVIFNLYQNNENDYISTNIKLDIGRTTTYYGDNDQPSTWFTGIGVIKLGTTAVSDNNYLCYITYNNTFYPALIITPINKLS